LLIRDDGRIALNHGKPHLNHTMMLMDQIMQMQR